MAWVKVKHSTLVAIGNAIRNKLNTAISYNAAEMVNAIETIGTETICAGGTEVNPQVLTATTEDFTYSNNRITKLRAYAFSDNNVNNGKLIGIDLPNAIEIGSYAFADQK